MKSSYQPLRSMCSSLKGYWGSADWDIVARRSRARSHIRNTPNFLSILRTEGCRLAFQLAGKLKWMLRSRHMLSRPPAEG